MFRSERHLAGHIANNIKSNSHLSTVKDVILEHRMSKAGFENVLGRYFDAHAPMYIAKPDIIIIAEDPKKVVDEWLLVAVELKYFKDLENAKKLQKDLRKAFREIGQPLRYYLYGFDSAILWHIFEEGADEEILRSYGNLITEVIEKLKLPMALFLTEIVDENDFRAFKPLEIDSPNNMGYLIRWMLNYCGNQVRNPLLPDDSKIKERRRALKITFEVP